jgi:hypothetical protein
MAGRALQTMCICRRLQPLPAPFMKFCAHCEQTDSSSGLPLDL